MSIVSAVHDPSSAIVSSAPSVHSEGGAMRFKRSSSLRPLRRHEALCLAWLDGVVHECLHPFSEVLIDEGSTPIALPCDVVSRETLKLLMRRGFVRWEIGLDADVIYSLTLAGRHELYMQRAHGLLSSTLPLDPSVPKRWIEYDEADSHDSLVSMACDSCAV